jgi:uncharacterized protein
MHAAVIGCDIHIPQSRSLKEKRSVIRHILDTARNRYGVSASEVQFQDLWQRAELGFACIGPDAPHVRDVLDSVERFVWSQPEIEVSAVTWHWLETDD